MTLLQVVSNITEKLISRFRQGKTKMGFHEFFSGDRCVCQIWNIILHLVNWYW